MFITFLLVGNNIISVESRHLIFVYLYTRTQSIQKKIFEYDVKSKYREEYSTVDKAGREKLSAVKSCFLYTSSPPHFFWSPSKLDSTFKRVPFFVFEILIALFHCRKEKHKDSSRITDKALKTRVYEVFALVVCFAPLVISTPVSMFFSKIGRQKSQLRYYLSKVPHVCYFESIRLLLGAGRNEKICFQNKMQVLQPVVWRI